MSKPDWYSTVPVYLIWFNSVRIKQCSHEEEKIFFLLSSRLVHISVWYGTVRHYTIQIGMDFGTSSMILGKYSITDLRSKVIIYQVNMVFGLHILEEPLSSFIDFL